MSELASGDHLDPRFSLIRPLGQGGMAEVWLARDHELGEEVAVKIVPPGASEETIALLRRECQNARRLTHPNIVRVFDFHRGEERCFITMAHVDGRDLGALRGAPPAETVRVLIPLVDALGYAHGLGVIHRDLKADNVILDESGRPHVLDFGIAAVLAASAGRGRVGDEKLTVSGGGSPHAMSPQQLDGAEPAPADDIYALGALLYELISGRPPLWPQVTDERIRSVDPEPVRSAHPLPERLRALTARMLAKAPADRPADMNEVKTELAAILDELERADESMAPSAKQIRLTPPPRTQVVRPTAPQPAGGGTAQATSPARQPLPTAPHPGAAQDHKRLLITAAIVVPLILIAAFVLFFLPGWLERSPQPAAVDDPAPMTTGEATTVDAVEQPAEESTLPTPEDLKARAARMESAEDAMQRATSFRDRLEQRGASRWASDDFAAALVPLATGEERLAAGDYAEAQSAFEDSIRQFEAIAATGPEVLRAALEQGRQALAAGDSRGAASAFRMAATIDPGSSAASNGLRRAEVLDELLELLDAGARAESAGRTDEAEQAYRRAVELDGLSQAAQQALARVQSRISNDAFATIMSQGLEALERGDNDTAREAFKRADAMRPGSAEVAEALRQVEQSASLDAIVDYRERAATAEAVEDWRTAADAYDAILKLDPTIRFAQEGHDRCERRADMAARIDYHLTHPDRLSTDSVFEEALELLVQASEIEPAGPIHRRQLQALDALVQTASIPIPVLLLSDAETEVTVYRVGRLGAFEQHELKLRPGRYTVVGSREGYRDVRLTFQVVAGRPAPSLTVKCEEPI
jgi:tetratricopeptide (TPR) repeat protein